MKFFTPEGGELIEIMTVTPERDGVLIQGKIMGAMPMKAVLKPEAIASGLQISNAASRLHAHYDAVHAIQRVART